MPLSFQLQGLEPLVGQIDELKKRIEGLYQNVPEELTAWQEDDMHRKRPSTRERIRGRSLRASTVIRPRSARSQRYRAARREAIRAAARAARRRSGLHRLARTKPILRPELFDELCQRMAELMRKTLTWK